jgi:peptidyl-tRNA hydrolase
MENDTLDYGNKVDRVSNNKNINNFEVIYNNEKEKNIHNDLYYSFLDESHEEVNGKIIAKHNLQNPILTRHQTITSAELNSHAIPP